MPELILAKYGQALTVSFSLFNPDGVDFKTSATHEDGDTKIKKDGGSEVNTTNGFTSTGQDHSIDIEETELESATSKIIIVDQTNPKAWLDDYIKILTYGHPNAHIKGDLDGLALLALEATAQEIAAYVDDLEFRLTAARAANLDNLDVPITSRATKGELIKVDVTSKITFDPIEVVKGDTIVLRYLILENGIPKDLTGYSAKFAVQLTPSYSEYQIGPVDATVYESAGEIEFTDTVPNEVFKGVFEIALYDPLSKRTTLTPAGGVDFRSKESIVDA
jgi:hypothetical protein